MTETLIEKESAAVPSQHIVCCSMLANRLMEMEINGAPISYEISKSAVTCSLTQKGDQKSLLSGYDLAVLEALHTIWEYGRDDHIISYGSIYRVVVHNTGFDTPSTDNLNRVKKSLGKLKSVKLHMRSGDAETSEPLIRLGTNETAMCILSEPAVLKQCKELRQIKTVSADLLSVQDESGKITQNRAAFIDTRERLLRQVVIQSRMKKKNPLITLDTIFGKTFKTLSAKQRKRLVEYICLILSYWRRRGLIESYAPRKKGRTIDAIRLSFTSQNRDRSPRL